MDPVRPSRAPRPRRTWLAASLAIVIAIMLAALIVFLVATRNPEVSAFYQPPPTVPPEPGTIIRSEPLTGGVPAGATGWRVLYTSTDEHGTPIAVSGLIFAPQGEPTRPGPVLAWAHGTTGIVPPCAPSLSADPFAGIPDMSGPLAEGWVLAMADYPGLGTPGPHPYLVGASEGRAVLDAVRAAHRLDLEMPLDDRYVIWGHSQGGHAALFAGQLAPTYLPELELAGVAALSPATLLADNFGAIEGTEAGNVLTILAVHAWSRYYDDISADVLSPAARRPAEQIANACLNQPSLMRIVVAGLTLPAAVTDVDVVNDPSWHARMTENSPEPDGIATPLFVAQGLADELIVPAVTDAWVERRCATGGPVTFRTYPDVTHPGIVGPGGIDALAWTRDRLAGEPAASTCDEAPG